MSSEEAVNENDKIITELITKEDEYKKDSEKLYLDFISKLVLYSSGIVTTSITWFITLSDKSNISELKNYFTFIIIFGFITIVSGLFIVLYNSKQKDIQSDIFRNSQKDFLPWFNRIKVIDKGIIFDKKYAKWKNLTFCCTCIAMISFILSIASIIRLFLSINL